MGKRDHRQAVGRCQSQTEPADYTKAATDFASAAAELASENLAAFAEVAKKVQMETVELLLAAGKDVSAEASAVVKKATDDVAAATKKATAAAAAKVVRKDHNTLISSLIWDA